MWSDYAFDWLLNFLLIAIVVGLADSYMHNRLEKHQTIGAFFLFVLPTVLELFAYFVYHRPFLGLLF